MNQCAIIGDILIFLGVAFTVYLSVVMIRRINAVVLRESYVKVFRYELLVCAAFLLFAVDIRFGFLMSVNAEAVKAVSWIIRIALWLAVAVLVFLLGKIFLGACIHTDASAENAIVLGMALENGKPTADLELRLDTAVQYLERNPGSTVILSGGNPDESGRTEAVVMHDLLIERGIEEERMILEDQSDTTKANFKNISQLIDPDAPVVLITSNYHMDRAVQIAKSAGFSNILRLPAPSSSITFGSNVMLEIMMDLNELTLKINRR